jgi:hypothetical protein
MISRLPFPVKDWPLHALGGMASKFQAVSERELEVLVDAHSHGTSSEPLLTAFCFWQIYPEGTKEISQASCNTGSSQY